MVMSDANGIPVSAFTIEANVAEVHCIETLLEMNQSSRQIRRLIYDKAADADWLRDQLESRNIELVTPHRSNRKRPPRQDRRKLRRYRSRWVIERTMSWLQSNRRLLVRHERYAHLFEGFLHLACVMILLNRF